MNPATALLILILATASLLLSAKSSRPQPPGAAKCVKHLVAFPGCAGCRPSSHD